MWLINLKILAIKSEMMNAKKLKEIFLFGLVLFWQIQGKIIASSELHQSDVVYIYNYSHCFVLPFSIVML